MKGKLIKRTNERYDLYYSDDINQLNTIASTQHESNIGKLSLKRCQAIERGYDFDEYLEGVFYAGLFGHPSPEGFSDEQVGRLHGFIDGFQKALQLLGDKKYSIEDIQNVIDSNDDSLVYQTVTENGDISFGLDEDVLIQSLQPTEWDVEVEMECRSGCRFLILNGTKSECCGDVVQKLDPDGCLILKKWKKQH